MAVVTLALAAALRVVLVTAEGSQGTECGYVKAQTTR